jgi:hypothetical protein
VGQRRRHSRLNSQDIESDEEDNASGDNRYNFPGGGGDEVEGHGGRDEREEE